MDALKGFFLILIINTVAILILKNFQIPGHILNTIIIKITIFLLVDIISIRIINSI